MITTVINPFDGLISRYFITLDPVLNSSYEMAQPITFAGDFEIEVEFSTTSFAGHIIVSTSEITQDYIFVRSSTGEVGLRVSDGAITGTIVVADGELHTIKVTKVGTTVSLFVDGVFDGTATTTITPTEIGLIGRWAENSLYYSGIIANAKFTDKSGASDVVTTFRLGNSPAAENYIYGGELVANGDFSDGATGWNLGTGWALVESKMTKVSGVNSSLRMTSVANTLTVGGSYEVSFSIEHTAGILDRVYLTGSSTQFLGITASGDYSYVLIADSTSLSARFISGSSFEGSIDNITVKEVTNYTEANAASEIEYSQENVFGSELVVNGDFATDSDWTKGTGWSISGGKANFTNIDLPTKSLQAIGNVFETGKSYLVSFDVESDNPVGFQGAGGGIVASGTTGKVSVVWVADVSFLIFKRAGGTATGYIDNVSVKEITNAVEYKNIPQSARELYSLEDDTWTDAAGNTIEVADFIEPVTQGMTLTEAWTTRGTAYSTLGNTTSASVRVDATISNIDDGVLMEAGGSGQGTILYVYSGVLYFQCGDGSAYGTASDRAEVSYTLPTGEFRYIIEWSADTSNAVLYVNGLLVGSQTFSDDRLAGSDDGTVGEIWNSVVVNRGGWVPGDLGTYTNTITKCDIFNHQITSDV